MNRLLHAIRCGPYLKSVPHHHREWEIGWYTAGRSRVWIGAQEIEVSPGTLVCYPPLLDHHEQAEEELEGIFVLIDALDATAETLVLRGPAGQTAGRIMELLAEQFAAGGARPDGVAQPLLEALIAYLRTQRSGPQLHPQVERLLGILRERVGDPTVRIANVMRELPISRDHLRRLFSEQTGQTPVAYLRELRIHRAQNLLGMGRSIKEAGLEAGFDDQYYFSRVFREVTGQAPSAWRSSHLARGRTREAR